MCTRRTRTRNIKMFCARGEQRGEKKQNKKRTSVFCVFFSFPEQLHRSFRCVHKTRAYPSIHRKHASLCKQLNPLPAQGSGNGRVGRKQNAQCAPEFTVPVQVIIIINYKHTREVQSHRHRARSGLTPPPLQKFVNCPSEK